MIVDPSLARGLRQAFWKYTNEQATQTQEVLTKIIARHKPYTPFSQKAFRRFATEIAQGVPSSSLVLTKREGRRQFIACMFLDHEPSEALNEWHEHILVGYQGIFYRDQKSSDIRRSVARIGEHAVQRLFQRGGPRIGERNEFDHSSYADDIKNALAWAEMLRAVADPLQNSHNEAGLSVLAPTSSGAFVGQVSSDRQWLDFRTFISLEKMFPEQRNLREALLAIEQEVGIEHLGLNFGSWLDDPLVLHENNLEDLPDNGALSGDPKASGGQGKARWLRADALS